MSDEALQRFRDFLVQRGATADASQELLRHEMGATLNRHRLTGGDEGIQSFNTSQLCGLVVAQTAWSREQAFVTGLMLSALIDGEHDIFAAAQAEGLIPAAWTWVSWADGFTGDATELRQRLSVIPHVREQCGAVCLATRTNPGCIGILVMSDFCHVPLATVYHHLLRKALAGPHAAAIATSELARLADHLEVLFAADTDATLAALVGACAIPHPEIMVAKFKDAAGDLTQAALAQRHLELGRPQQALELVKDMRFLSSAYDQAIVVAALSALECKKFEMAEFYCRSIPNEDTRLKIVTRVAQATGDPGVELDALTRLYERNPHDAQVFAQLVGLLMRIGQSALASALCADAQERFVGDAQVDRIIKRVLAPR